ncbi:hypothetical protein M3P36_06580 [Altererythrobacter sp. KTW20L]|uniref:hypothetical protein n=1 Tax=Altererythrobacter sp. KTW20L TaxID=2942210 RepID=UPI0020BE3924|nr:hypothetical protein [Altererythrobacter sp. KTW20L]MCL6250710.1 hypothetical protein [Altererythrobacter sp. KTW20L]
MSAENQAIGEQGLALLLEASRNFAISQIAQGQRLIPFAGRANAAGEIDFIRFVDEDTELPLDEIYDKTQAAIAEEARAGQLVAATMVSAVGGTPGQFGEGFDSAIRVHVEAPDYSRVVLAPFRVEQSEGQDAKLVVGELLPIEADPAIFAA